MIHFDNVDKQYDKITALKEVTFDIPDGEFCFIVGPSGAGKSTIMKLLIREELPTKGNITFGKIDVPKLPNKLVPEYRQQIGMVFQDLKLLQSKTLEENIGFALEILNKSEKEIKDTTDYLLELVDLADRKHLFPKELSGGEQQRGAIARALANNPKVLVADEPTGNLDPENARDLLKILQTINASGTTVIVITHNRDLVDPAHKRVIRLDEGSIISDSRKGSYASKTPPKKKQKGESKKKEVEKKADVKSTVKEETKTKKETKVDRKVFEKLSKRLRAKLEKNNIKDANNLLDLTTSEFKKLKLSKKEKKSVEKFLQNYLKTKNK
jgi:cell division transport system ATP-binding protein